MKHTLLALLLLLAAQCGANPLGLPEYQREIVVNYKSPEDAAKAELEIHPHFEDKPIAFSTRWDDTNPKHVRMAELLTRHGFRGTFYLNQPNASYIADVLPKLLTNGNTIGNHTLNHPSLGTVVPNAVARQILKNRVLLEAASERPVTAFVLPYGSGNLRKPYDSDCALRVGEALRRSGALGSPQFGDLAALYGMPEGSWFGSSLFSANDRKPDRDRFKREMEKRLAARKDGEYLHITFGLHTWQDDDGFNILGQCYDLYGKRNDFWYCNENEYLAYRYSALHSRITKKRTDGSKAIFTLRQPLPAGLGSDIPLSAKSSIPTATDDQRILLPHAPGLMPVKIDHIANPENQTAILKSAEIPGLSGVLTADREKNELTLTLVNETGGNLENLEITYRLPLLFKAPGVIREIVGTLPPGGKTFTRALDPQKDPLYHTGPLFYAAELNFAREGHTLRLWFSTEESLYKKEAVPRDLAIAYGPLQPSEFPPELLAAASRPGTSLREWKPLKVNPEFYPCFFQLPRKEKLHIAVLFSFEREKEEEVPLFLDKGCLELYLNGANLALNPAPKTIRAAAGVNRIVALFEASGTPLFSIAPHHPYQPIPFLEPGK